MTPAWSADGPSLDEYAAGSVSDALFLGVPANEASDKQARDARAVRVLDEHDQLAEDADLVAVHDASLHPHEVPPVDLAVLIHDHGGDVAAAVAEPGFEDAARTHLRQRVGPAIDESARENLARDQIDAARDLARAPGYHQVQAGSLTGEVTLGVIGNGPDSNARRAARAALVVAEHARIEDAAYAAAAAAREPDVPGLPIARLLVDHGGDARAVVDDQDFVDAARDRAGLSGEWYTSMDEGKPAGPREWYDPVGRNPDAFAALHDDVNRARAAVGAAAWSEREFARAAGVDLDQTHPAKVALAGWDRQVDRQVDLFEGGEDPEALTEHVRGLFGDIPTGVAFMRDDPVNRRVVMEQAAARTLVARGAELPGGAEEGIGRREAWLQREYGLWRAGAVDDGPGGPGRAASAAGDDRIARAAEKLRDYASRDEPDRTLETRANVRAAPEARLR